MSHDFFWCSSKMCNYEIRETFGIECWMLSGDSQIISDECSWHECLFGRITFILERYLLSLLIKMHFMCKLWYDKKLDISWPNFPSLFESNIVVWPKVGIGNVIRSFLQKSQHSYIQSTKVTKYYIWEWKISQDFVVRKVTVSKIWEWWLNFCQLV